MKPFSRKMFPCRLTERDAQSRRASFPFLSLLSFLLIALLLFPTAVSGISGNPNPLDYRRAGSGDAPAFYAETIPPSELLILTGTGTLTDAELAYLDTCKDLSLSYHPQIPNSTVSFSYVSDTMIALNATDYTYTAENGMTVTWIATEATFGGQTVSLSHTANFSFALLPYTASDRLLTVPVSYEATLIIPAETLNELQNRAFSDAKQAEEEELLYTEALRAYEASVAAYQDYLAEAEAYRIEEQKYQNYLLLLAEYHDAVARRKEYEEALERYEKDLAAYRDYCDAVDAYKKAEVSLAAELAAREAEFAAYRKYLAYRGEVDACMERLSALDSAFLTSSAGHQMYATLKGPTVAEVVAQKDTLVRYCEVGAADIDNADASTRNLIALLSAYKALSGEEERFAWYQKNYPALRDNFALLYSSLYSLLKNYLVASELQRREKFERYCQFVAQLYVISTCLDDKMTTDPLWTIDGRALSEVLEADYQMPDRNNASPDGVSFPEPVPPAEEPVLTTVLPPYPETELYPPLEPRFVPEAGDPPAEVTKPVPPAEVPAPGEAPQKPEVSTELAAVLAEVRAGTVTKRAAPTAAKALTVTSMTEACLKPEGETRPLVTFCGYDGQVLGHFLLPESLPADFGPGSVPLRPLDEKYHYTQTGWMTADGSAVTLSKISADICLYPAYAAEENSYIVTWVTANGEWKESYRYGELPLYAGDPSKAPDDRFVYHFSGWDKTPAPVTGDVTYTAQYTAEERLCTVLWKIGDETVRSVVPYGQIPVCPVDPGTCLRATATEFLSFVSWDIPPAAATGDCVYTAVIARTPLVPVTHGETVFSATVLTDQTTCTVTLPEEPYDSASVDLSLLLFETVGARRDLLLLFPDGLRVTIPYECLKDLDSGSGLILSFSRGNTEGALFSLRISLRTSSGAPVSCNGIQVLTPLPNLPEATVTGYASSEGGTPVVFPFYQSGDNAVFVSDGTADTYYLFPLYRLTAEETEHGQFLLSHRTARPGETIRLTLYPDKNYTVSLLRVTATVNGETVILPCLPDGVSFEMPEGPVTISVSFVPAVYRVSFYVNGVLYATREYNSGEELVFPEDPADRTDGDSLYTFSGWSPSPVRTVVCDAEYSAVFTESALAKEDLFHISPYTTYVPWKLILIASSLLLLTVLGTVLTVRHVRKKKT